MNRLAPRHFAHGLVQTCQLSTEFQRASWWPPTSMPASSSPTSQSTDREPFKTRLRRCGLTDPRFPYTLSSLISCMPRVTQRLRWLYPPAPTDTLARLRGLTLSFTDPGSLIMRSSPRSSLWQTHKQASTYADLVIEDQDSGGVFAENSDTPISHDHLCRFH